MQVGTNAVCVSATNACHFGEIVFDKLRDNFLHHALGNPDSARNFSQCHIGEILGANIRIESIVSAEVADRLLQLISNEYFDRFAVIAYLSTVSVVRGEKYV